jgi:nitrate/TMAO reductase-like tetraheme cytochrome c subunit
MNKKILTIAITCFFCFLLITNYVVADKPEWAGKPEGITKQQAEPDALNESYLKGSREEKSQQCRNEIASLLEEECSSCHNEDVTVFTEKGNKTKEDMKAAIAIGVKCEYCHAGKEQFTDKFEMALNMFKLSEMMDVECNLCHKGKDILTSKGRTARTAMLLREWVKTGNKTCLECHDEKKQFELNPKGNEILESQMEEMLQAQKG